MPPKGKSKARSFKSASSSKPASASLTELDPPAPFKRPAKHLEPFLSKLQKSHIYITHVDTKPKDFKRKIFLVPVLMNVAIIGLMLWRIKVVGTFYLQICFALMGKVNEMTIDSKSTPVNVMVKELLRRTGVFLVDLLIYVFIWPWPKDFFFGTKIGNPCAWRVKVGFRDKEIIIRRSRKWDLMIGDILEEGFQREETFRIVKKAVDPIWMNEKTGYLMLNREWDLDWKAIIAATKLVDQQTLKLDDFKPTVFVYSKEFGWMCEDAGGLGTEKEVDGRRKIVAFKDELTAMGKENLFFKWIELVQYDSSQPEGFGPEQQAKTMIKAKQMFASQGVDFDRFWAKIGGMQGMPGMDQM